MTKALASLSSSGLYTDPAFKYWYSTDEATAYTFTAPVNSSFTLHAKWEEPASDVDISGQSGNNTLEKALNYISGQAAAEYTIVLDGNSETYTMAGTSSANIDTANAVITLVGKNPTTISLTGTGNLFNITAGELILDNNITLKGVATNTASMILVNSASASLTMKAGAAISGNQKSSNYGGGVFVDNGGSFTMEGGTISGNSADVGGGIYIKSGGSFTMRGGTISGNITDSGTKAGGGVCVGDGGIFTMEGGEISDNSASRGGGVIVVIPGSFEKTGGVIYGDTDNSYSSGNTENTATSAASGWGHAVYCHAAGGENYYRDADLENNDGGKISTGDLTTNWTKQ
jgi:hypothetical protein